jgi:hypothetical protein
MFEKILLTALIIFNIYIYLSIDTTSKTAINKLAIAVPDKVVQLFNEYKIQLVSK